MRFWQTTAARVALAVLTTALLPMGAMLAAASGLIARVSSSAFHPDVGAALDQSLGVYKDLAGALKATMRAEAAAMASSPALVKAADAGDQAALRSRLAAMLDEHPSLARVSLEPAEPGDEDEADERVAPRPAGRPAPVAERAEPVAAGKLRTLTVRRPVGSEFADEASAPARGARPLVLVATFATPAARFEELERASATIDAYRAMASSHREELIDTTYFKVFAALFAMTVALAIAAGILVARPVTRRLAVLAEATRRLGEGDLGARVPEGGAYEVATLAVAFNRMLRELEQSRARIEFLRRMGEWQVVARKLAHEIKNPLTPIRLAVEECHRRYDGRDEAYGKLLQTTLEVVEEEVASLHRLVAEFSSFARLPRAELEPGDLRTFLLDKEAHLSTSRSGREGDIYRDIDVRFELPEAPMPADFDGEMLHRAVGNLVRNAAEAIAQREAPSPREGGDVIRVRARAEAARYVLEVDDTGPGIEPALRETLFDPYVTGKPGGTGLGLAIVKKIFLEHGGGIAVGASELGGASFRVELPAKRADAG